MKTLLIILILNPFNAFSKTFEEINFENFEKTILSAKQIRFVDKRDSHHIIHLQINKFDSQNTWTEKNLDKDIEEMMSTRKSLYEILGFSDVRLDQYSLDRFTSHSQLNLYGSYVKFKKSRVFFSESNIYFSQNFFQIKIISEKSKVAPTEAENFVKQIQVDTLGIK